MNGVFPDELPRIACLEGEALLGYQRESLLQADLFFSYIPTRFRLHMRHSGAFCPLKQNFLCSAPSQWLVEHVDETCITANKGDSWQLAGLSKYLWHPAKRCRRCLDCFRSLDCF